MHPGQGLISHDDHGAVFSLAGKRAQGTEGQKMPSGGLDQELRTEAEAVGLVAAHACDGPDARRRNRYRRSGNSGQQPPQDDADALAARVGDARLRQGGQLLLGLRLRGLGSANGGSEDRCACRCVLGRLPRAIRGRAQDSQHCPLLGYGDGCVCLLRGPPEARRERRGVEPVRLANAFREPPQRL